MAFSKQKMMALRQAKNLNSIGDRLLYIRSWHGMNRTEFAKYLGFGMSTLYYYENNMRKPRPHFLKRLEELGWSQEWILTGKLPDEDEQLFEDTLESKALLLQNLITSEVKQVENLDALNLMARMVRDIRKTFEGMEKRKGKRAKKDTPGEGTGSDLQEEKGNGETQG